MYNIYRSVVNIDCMANIDMYTYLTERGSYSKGTKFMLSNT